jgi:hypothetical protein
VNKVVAIVFKSSSGERVSLKEGEQVYSPLFPYLGEVTEGRKGINTRFYSLPLSPMDSSTKRESRFSVSVLFYPSLF